jgi:tetratricopeptide (TPR) repeat protein
VLVVLDNAVDSEQVRPLLPGAAGCLAILTSRNQLTSLLAAQSAYPVTLDLMTHDEAALMLTRRLGHDRVAAEPDSVDELITCCARLPLALAIVAAHAATNPRLPLAALAAELRNSGDRLDMLSTGDPGTDPRAVFSWSYHALTPAAARLFRLLGLHPGPDISTAATASLAALPSPNVRPLLTEMGRANLIHEHSPGRYTFHDLLRTYAGELAHSIDPGHERRAATRRILDHYLHTAHTAARLVYPSRDPITLTPPPPGVFPEDLTDHERAMAWFTAEHSSLLAAVDHASTTGFDTHTWQLAWTLAIALGRRGHWHDLAATLQAAVAAARRLADPVVEAGANRLLARAYVRLGRFDDAHNHLRDALQLYQQANDRVGQAHTHRAIGYLWGRRQQPAEALDHTQQALGLYRGAGNRNGVADALNAVGWYHALLGDHRQAITFCQQALPLLQELNHRLGQAATWDSLGYANHHLGQYTQAISCYRNAIDLYQDLGERYEEGATLARLGDTHYATANPDAARDAWQEALTILDQLDHPDADTVRLRLDHPGRTDS